MNRRTKIYNLLAALLLCCGMLPAKAQWQTANSKLLYSYDYDLAFDATDTLYASLADQNDKVVVYRYINNTWTKLGSNLSINLGRYTSLTFNSANEPHVAFQDGAVSGKISVMKYSSGSWNVVGGYGFSSNAVTQTTDIIFDNNDTLYVAYKDQSTLRANVMKYNGSGWVQVGSTNFSNGNAWNLSLAADGQDSLYVAYIDKANNDYPTLKKYSNGSWITVATYPVSGNYLQMEADSSGELYIVVAADNDYHSVLKYDGSSLSVLGDSFFRVLNSAGGYYPDIDFDGNNTPYILIEEDEKNTVYNTVLKYTGSEWIQVGAAGLNTVNVGNTHNKLAVNSTGEIYAVCDEDMPVHRYVNQNAWNGSTWSNGSPNSSSNVFIESSTSPGAFTCGDLNVSPGVTLALGSSTVNVNNAIIYYGDSLMGSGTVNIADDVSMWGDTMYLKESSISVASGKTLTTNGRLGVGSDATGTGRIGTVSGTISGDVNVQRYIAGGVRAYRMLGHPFSTDIPLSQLIDDIDITGTGGVDSGFTYSTSNPVSAYWWDVTTADYSVGGTNPGWQAFTNTGDSWGKHDLALVYIRGAKGEGLSPGTYTPSAVTLQVAGELNQGTQVRTLTKGSNTFFAACGNPFASSVQMNTVTRGSNVGSNYYLWDPRSGASGAYVTNAWSLSYSLPMFSAFITTVTANTNNTLSFAETDKTTGDSALFKTTAPADWVELYIYDSTTKWDRLLINFDDNAMDVQDKSDAVKFYNPGLDFYTLSKDNERLAVDVRPYDDGHSIPLGLTAYNRYNTYVIRTGMFNIPAGTKLVLHDKYLNKTKELNAGTEYWFDVTSDSLSQGNKRFEINMVGKPTTGIIAAKEKNAQMQLIPNPAYSHVKVSFDKIEGEAQIKLTSITGQVVYQSITNTQTGSVTIPLQNVPAGIYIVELQGKNARFTEKLIKE
ncbi:MAG: T9SS type A sorting domain-containing protein [Chitinophagales bacterium]|nr:T9SS type A sorting domain-containing protein [Chitinophagales bacterium]